MAAPKKQEPRSGTSSRTTNGSTKEAAPSQTAGKTPATGRSSPAGFTTRSGRSSNASATTSPVSGRFVDGSTMRESGGGQPAAKSAALKNVAAPALPGHKQTPDASLHDIVTPEIQADAKAAVSKSAFPKGALDKLIDKDLLLVVSTGAGKSEMVKVEDDLAAYLTALRAQLDQVVLPSVLARMLKGAPQIAPEDLAARMLAVAPAPVPANKMAEQVGPEFYDTNGVKAILAAPGAEPVSKQAVEHRRNRHTILALQTSDRRWIYPAWQFRDHDVLPGLSDVLAAFYPQEPRRNQSAATTVGAIDPNLSGGTSGSGAVAVRRSATRNEPYSAWSVATWVTTPVRDLDGLSVADWLLENRDRDRVVELARRTAAAWAA